MNADRPIQIDLREVLKDKLGPEKAARVPAWLVRSLEKLIRRDELNALLASAHPAEGAEFCRKVLAELQITLRTEGCSNLPPAGSRPLIVSNHPLGGLDGIAMIAWLSEMYPGEHVSFLVNDLLMAIKPLAPVFLPINKHGAQSRKALADIDKALAADGPVVIYPAGLVSRKGRGGRIADLEWKKMFVAKAVEHRRDVVPVFFDGRNSSFFYTFSKIRKALGIKFNLDMLLLPGELVKARGSEFRLIVGKPLSWRQIAASGKPQTAIAAEIRDIVYSLPSQADPCK